MLRTWQSGGERAKRYNRSGVGGREGEEIHTYIQQEWSRVKVRRVEKRPKGDKEREKRQKRWGRGGERKGREGGGFRMFQAC